MKANWRRLGTNVFIVGFVTLILIDTLPPRLLHHQQLLAVIDPFLDVSGLQQGPWELFAPEIDRENHHIEVEVHFADGSHTTWRSPDWAKVSCWGKFHNVREIEFYDRIRNTSNRAAWSEFARYSANRIASEATSSSPIEKVSLFVISETIPNPDAPKAESAPQRDEFHTESLTP